MRNAQKTALMAIFAAMEERAEQERRTLATPEMLAESGRPIQVDLAAMARARLAGRRKLPA